jgi:hypothetical protein
VQSSAQEEFKKIQSKLLIEADNTILYLTTYSKSNTVDCRVGEVDFWIFWIFNFLQFAIDRKNNYKTKVEKVFFFIFMSSYAEMSFSK